MNKDEIAELIKLLRLEAVACRRAGPSDVADKLNKAANALTTLSAENERLERRNASDRECWRLAAENCAALSARVETLETALVAEREDNLWNAYNTGHVKDDRWSHMFMSDGEWLAVECGFDCNLADFDDAAIRAAIPVAARKALGGSNG